MYAIAELRFDRGPQAINSLANVRSRAAPRNLSTLGGRAAARALLRACACARPRRSYHTHRADTARASLFQTPSQAYYVWYCPGSVFALWAMERHGMRFSLLLGYASQVVMITMSVVGVHLAEPHVAYLVVWLGQARARV